MPKRDYSADLALCQDAAKIQISTQGNHSHFPFVYEQQAVAFLQAARERWPEDLRRLQQGVGDTEELNRLRAENRLLRRKLAGRAKC